MAVERSHSAMYLRREAARLRLRELDRQREALLRAFPDERGRRWLQLDQPASRSAGAGAPGKSLRFARPRFK